MRFNTSKTSLTFLRNIVTGFVFLVLGVGAGNAQKITGDTAICYGKSTTLTFSDSGSFVWSPATGLDNTGKKKVNASPKVTTTYKVSEAVIWKQVYSEYYHSVGIKSDGSLWTWGDNQYGQLGDSGAGVRYSPAQIGTSKDWKQLSTGRSHTLGLKTDGSLWAWGDNRYGQLGIGSLKGRYKPVRVGTANDWVFIASGDDFSLAIKSDGTLWSWGLNNKGQLGDGSITLKMSPVKVGTAKNWSKAEGGQYHTLALRTDGTLWSWGDNGEGQMGIGTKGFSIFPTQVGTDNKWTQISAGDYHSIGLKSDSTIWGWGNNVENQLGDGTDTNRLSPIRSGYDHNWIKIMAGGIHNLAIKADSSLWVWGYNQDGQLGDGTNSNKKTHTKITKFKDYTYLAAGHYFSMFLQSNGTLWSTGDNRVGQLGDGTTQPRKVPVRIGKVELASFTLKVNKLPGIAIKASDSIVCTGQSIILSGAGARSYTWSDSIKNDTSFVPLHTQKYTITGIDSNGCENTKSISIVVNKLPDVSIIVSDTGICLGETVTLTGNGAAIYNWNKGILNGKGFVPDSTDKYQLTGIDSNNCSNSKSVVIHVQELPNVRIKAIDTSLCAGESLILSGSGADSIKWSDNVINDSAFKPLTTQTYTLTGIDSGGCRNSKSIKILVNPLPAMNIEASDTLVCYGESVHFIKKDSVNYVLSGKKINSAGFIPDSTFSYIIRGTDLNGCSNKKTITITVNKLPIIGTIAGPKSDLYTLKSYDYSVKDQAGNFYTWSVSHGVIEKGQGTEKITVRWSSADTAVIKLVMRNPRDCVDSTSLKLVISEEKGRISFQNALHTTIIPNPITDHFCLKVNSSLIGVAYKISDITGKVIKEGHVESLLTNIDLSTCQKGVYFLSLGNNLKQCYRLIKE